MTGCLSLDRSGVCILNLSITEPFDHCAYGSQSLSALVLAALSFSRRGHLASTATSPPMDQVSSNPDTCYGAGKVEVLSPGSRSPPALRYLTLVRHLF